MNQLLNLPRRTLWTGVAALFLILTFMLHGRQWNTPSPGLGLSRQSRQRLMLEDINNATLGVSGKSAKMYASRC
jgi:hypothetical protein